MSSNVSIANASSTYERAEKSESLESQAAKIDWKSIWKPLSVITGAFLIFFWLPIDSSRFTGAVIESLALAKWYAQEHVLLCLIPAFFIAGAPQIGLARAVGAVMFSVVVGLIMQLLFRKEEKAKVETALHLPEPEVERPLWQNVVYFAVMVGILVFATWGKPQEPVGIWNAVYGIKWAITGLFSALLGLLLIIWFKVKPAKVIAAAVVVFGLAMIFPYAPLIAFSAGIVAMAVLTTTTRGETQSWFLSTWDFAKQIMPLLFAGVLVAGLLLGRHGSEGLIPSRWVSGLVGGNSLGANLFASVVGAFMYFATLTEVPILQGLLGAGMGKGPALALLLAGPALSLPNMLVIRSVMGTKKTFAFVGLVIVMATISGMTFGYYFA